MVISLGPYGLIDSPCFSVTRFSVVQCPLVTPAHSSKLISSSHSVQYCRYQTYSDALKNSSPVGLFHTGMVFLFLVTNTLATKEDTPHLVKDKAKQLVVALFQNF